jgi:hypothetical protein
METTKQLMIGGQALVALGSSRSTVDTDYLINDKTSKLPFQHDTASNIDYCNANGLKFFAAVWKHEAKNIGPLASPQALLELKAFSFVQNCLNGHWSKADDAEYDIKFLVRKFGLRELKIANKFISEGELHEVNRIIQSVKI